MSTLLDTSFSMAPASLSVLPGLRTDGPMNSNLISNFMGTSFTAPVGGAASNDLSSALANVPMGSNPAFLTFAGTQVAGSSDGLKSLVKQGIITEDEYKNQVRRSIGLSTSGSDSSDSAESLGELSGKTLEKARKSSKGDFKITDNQKAVASQLVEQVKEVLKKGPSNVTEDEAEGIEKLFKDLSKNPMIADAFIKEANETSFRGEGGKTSNVLAAYKEAMVKLHGQKEANEKTTEIEKKLYTTLRHRDNESFSEFTSSFDADDKKIKTTFGDKLAKHPGAVIGGAVATAAVAAPFLPTGFKVAKALCSIPGVGKFGLIGLGAVGVAASLYSLAKD